MLHRSVGPTKRIHNSTNLDGLVSVHDDRDEDTEDDVDEEADEDVEVDATVPPRVRVLFTDRLKRVVHIIAVDEREQALACRTEVAELKI